MRGDDLWMTVKVAPGLLKKATEYAGGFPGDAVVVLFHPTSIEALPKERLLYYPFLVPVREPSDGVFAATDTFEFKKRDPTAAGATVPALGELDRR